MSISDSVKLSKSPSIDQQERELARKGTLQQIEDICLDRAHWGPLSPNSATPHVPALGVLSGQA